MGWFGRASSYARNASGNMIKSGYFHYTWRSAFALGWVAMLVGIVLMITDCFTSGMGVHAFFMGVTSHPQDQAYSQLGLIIGIAAAVASYVLLHLSWFQDSGHYNWRQVMQQDTRLHGVDSTPSYTTIATYMIHRLHHLFPVCSLLFSIGTNTMWFLSWENPGKAEQWLIAISGDLVLSAGWTLCAMVFVIKAFHAWDHSDHEFRQFTRVNNASPSTQIIDAAPAQRALPPAAQRPQGAGRPQGTVIAASSKATKVPAGGATTKRKEPPAMADIPMKPKDDPSIKQVPAGFNDDDDESDW